MDCAANFFDRFSRSINPLIAKEIIQQITTGSLMGEGLYNPL